MGSTSVIRLDEWGCVVWVDNGVLYSSVIHADDSVNYGDYGEVTAPESQIFLDAVNGWLGTSFRYDEFPGR